MKRRETVMTGPTNEVALDALAAKIRIEHDAVREAAETATRHAIRCGKLLAEAKDGLVHGQWLPWLRDHCALSERTAQAYMRLARKHGELEKGKAQRVADLPVREAMKAIADERAENPELTEWRMWEWAEKQINGPFNAFDLTDVGLARNKLLRQTEVPAVAAFCISTQTEEIPMLRLVPFNELPEAFDCLAPVAKGSCDGLDIDFHEIASEAATFIATLILSAERACGSLLREIDYRCDTYKAVTPEEYAEQWGPDFDKVRTAFLENCDAKLAELGEAA